MLKTIPITAIAPLIVVIQGAYKEFCTQTAPRPTEYYGVMGPSGPVIVAQQDAMLSTEPPVADWLKFQRLVTEWRAQRGAMSSISEAAMCPAYQSIIGMGPLAVPFILAQLESEGDEQDQWFWALRAIVGTDPVADEDRGNYAKMAASWFAWAQNEYGW